MTDTNDNDDDEVVEISAEEFEEMLAEAIDIIALGLPEDAGDDYWQALRETVEERAREMREG